MIDLTKNNTLYPKVYISDTFDDLSKVLDRNTQGDFHGIDLTNYITKFTYSFGIDEQGLKYTIELSNPSQKVEAYFMSTFSQFYGKDQLLKEFNLAGVDFIPTLYVLWGYETNGILKETSDIHTLKVVKVEYKLRELDIPTFVITGADDFTAVKSDDTTDSDYLINNSLSIDSKRMEKQENGKTYYSFSKGIKELIKELISSTPNTIPIFLEDYNIENSDFDFLDNLAESYISIYDNLLASDNEKQNKVVELLNTTDLTSADYKNILKTKPFTKTTSRAFKFLATQLELEYGEDAAYVLRSGATDNVVVDSNDDGLFSREEITTQNYNHAKENIEVKYGDGTQFNGMIFSATRLDIYKVTEGQQPNFKIGDTILLDDGYMKKAQVLACILNPVESASKVIDNYNNNKSTYTNNYNSLVSHFNKYDLGYSNAIFNFIFTDVSGKEFFRSVEVNSTFDTTSPQYKEYKNYRDGLIKEVESASGLGSVYESTKDFESVFRVGGTTVIPEIKNKVDKWIPSFPGFPKLSLLAFDGDTVPKVLERLLASINEYSPRLITSITCDYTSLHNRINDPPMLQKIEKEANDEYKNYSYVIIGSDVTMDPLKDQTPDTFVQISKRTLPNNIKNELTAKFQDIKLLSYGGNHSIIKNLDFVGDTAFLYKLAYSAKVTKTSTIFDDAVNQVYSGGNFQSVVSSIISKDIISPIINEYQSRLDSTKRKMREENIPESVINNDTRIKNIERSIAKLEKLETYRSQESVNLTAEVLTTLGEIAQKLGSTPSIDQSEKEKLYLLSLLSDPKAINIFFNTENNGIYTPKDSTNIKDNFKLDAIGTKELYNRELQKHAWKVKVTTPGLPEYSSPITVFSNSYVYLDIRPSIDNSTLRHWLTGLYKIIGVAHAMNTSDGYITTLDLVSVLGI